MLLSTGSFGKGFIGYQTHTKYFAWNSCFLSSSPMTLKSLATYLKVLAIPT